MILFEYIINIIEMSIIYYLINNLLSRKNNFKLFYTFIFIGISFALVSVINLYKELEDFYIYLFFILQFIYGKLFFKNSNIEIITVSILPEVLVYVINSILFTLYTKILFGQISIDFLTGYYYYTFIILTKLVFFVSCFFISKTIKKNELSFKKTELIYIIVLLLAVNTMFISFNSLVYSKFYSDTNIIISIISITIIFIVFFKLIININKNSNELEHKKHQIELLNYEIENTKKNLELNSQLSIAKHDIIHLISLLKSSATKKELEFNKNIIEKYNQKVEAISIPFNTSNETVNYILSSKKEKAISNNIDFKTTVNIASDIKIDELDLSLLLSNLLDNAIENCTGKKRIEIIIKNTNMFTMIIQNSIDKSILKNNPKLKTSKNAKDHGYGIKCIKEIINKYKGEIIFEEKADYFIVYISI
jgi:sensor histidine kinase YesM